ncbi:MAG: hypothetical protein E6713_02190 [Sporomusaceae bacterium]|nr:hypothetical protein [Sporomusaceae bacterium]
MNYLPKRIFLSVLLCLSLILFAIPALAHEGREGHGEGLSWETTNVHFRGDRLVVEGYFQNNTDREIIDNINEFYVKVKLKHRGEWRQHMSVRYDNINVFIRPGESHPFRFVIEGVEPHRIDDYRVWTTGSYHYHNHHGWEYHRHEID